MKPKFPTLKTDKDTVKAINIQQVILKQIEVCSHEFH